MRGSNGLIVCLRYHGTKNGRSFFVDEHRGNKDLPVRFMITLPSGGAKDAMKGDERKLD